MGYNGLLLVLIGFLVLYIGISGRYQCAASFATCLTTPVSQLDGKGGIKQVGNSLLGGISNKLPIGAIGGIIKGKVGGVISI